MFAGSPGGSQIDANIVHYRHLTLVGSTGSTRRDYQAAYSLVREGKVPLARLPHQVISLEEAVTTLREPDAVPDRRSIIEIRRSPPR